MGKTMSFAAIALVEPAINTVAYHLHEKVWLRIQQRRQARQIDEIGGLPA